MTNPWPAVALGAAFPLALLTMMAWLRASGELSRHRKKTIQLAVYGISFCGCLGMAIWHAQSLTPDVLTTHGLTWRGANALIFSFYALALALRGLQAARDLRRERTP